MPRSAGFDPSRLTNSPRPSGVVRSILTPLEVEVKGLAEIRAVGVGGAGTNAINRVVSEHVQGIDCIAVNCDLQGLKQSLSPRQLWIGEHVTNGLGAGGDPARGRRAAEESLADIARVVANADMVFVTAGLGGGTGTGASPVVAEAARKAGALTVGVVTRPFSFEGARRRAVAEQGIEELLAQVDSLLIIPNDRLLDLATRRASLTEMFKMADDVMVQGIRGITDLIVTTGLVNVDFADVHAVMHQGGLAMMGTGTGYGDQRAENAARQAIASPVLETSIKGARSVLLNITGGPDLTLHDVNRAADMVAQAVDPDANIIFGAFIHPRLSDTMKLTLIATGLPGAGARP